MDYFLLGKTLKHTMSPEIHKEFGLEYGVKEIFENELQNFIEKKNFKGFNVTIPYKEKIIPYLDTLDVVSKNIGAVNTVILKDGKLFGYNTDAKGMERALSRAGIILKDKTVCILGSGGTAKTARFLALELSAKRIYTVSRKGEINYSNVYNYSDIEVIINTTPVGMYPNIEESPIDLTKFPNIKSVFDAVYNPLKTSLILQAQTLKLNASGGLFMLIEQARLSFELFTESKSDKELSEKLYNKILRSRTNIVLCGMPGSGKTTLGKLLAEKMNRKFFDTDRLIEEKYLKPISEIFDLYSEKGFRNMEKEIIKEVSKVTGAVIATGGGALTDIDNRKNLLKNGMGVYIKRDLNLLEKTGRPLSQSNKSLEGMLKLREPVYLEFSDFFVDNINIETALKEIITDYEKTFDN